jgi:hypothetical protein
MPHASSPDKFGAGRGLYYRHTGGMCNIRIGMQGTIMEFAEWFPLLAVGTTFTSLGCLKFYGLLRGIQGGRDKPFFQYVCGT